MLHGAVAGESGAGIRVEVANGLHHVGKGGVVDAQCSAQAVEVAVAYVVDVSVDCFIRQCACGVGGNARAQLNEQTFAQIGSSDAGRVEGLDYFNHRLHLLLAHVDAFARENVVADVVSRAAEIAVAVDVANHIVANKPLLRGELKLVELFGEVVVEAFLFHHFGHIHFVVAAALVALAGEIGWRVVIVAIVVAWVVVVVVVALCAVVAVERFRLVALVWFGLRRRHLERRVLVELVVDILYSFFKAFFKHLTHKNG